jgi:prophage regulatory protein
MRFKMNKIIRQRDAIKLTGLSRTTIWRLERAGNFPQRRRLGRNSIGWLETELRDWIDSRPKGLQPADQDGA